MKKGSLRKFVPSAVDIGSAAILTGASVALGTQPGNHMAGLVAIGLAQPFLVRITEWIAEPQNPEKLRHQLSREFLDELKVQLAKLETKFRSAISESQQASLSIEEVTILIEQYRDRAIRSANEERRRLLAAAAASTFRLDIELETKTRVERALANLEPSDIAILRRLAKAEYGINGVFREQPLVNQTALSQSGCVALDSRLEMKKEIAVIPTGKPPTPVLHEDISVTPLGFEVLKIVETYRPQKPTPSRHAT